MSTENKQNDLPAHDGTGYIEHAEPNPTTVVIERGLNGDGEPATLVTSIERHEEAKAIAEELRGMPEAQKLVEALQTIDPNMPSGELRVEDLALTTREIPVLVEQSVVPETTREPLPVIIETPTGIDPSEVPGIVAEAYRRSGVEYAPGDVEDTTALVASDIAVLQQQNEPLPSRNDLVDQTVEFIREMNSATPPVEPTEPKLKTPAPGEPGSEENPISLDPNTEAALKANKGSAFDILGEGIAERKKAFDAHKEKIGEIVKSKRYKAGEIVAIIPLIPLLLLAWIGAGLSVGIAKVAEAYGRLAARALALVFFPKVPAVLKLTKEQQEKVNEAFRRVEESQK